MKIGENTNWYPVISKTTTNITREPKRNKTSDK